MFPTFFWMLTLVCMLRPYAVQQGNQTGQFHVALEKDRHRAKCRVELFANLRRKAASRLSGSSCSFLLPKSGGSYTRQCRLTPEDTPIPMLRPSIHSCH